MCWCFKEKLHFDKNSFLACLNFWVRINVQWWLIALSPAEMLRQKNDESALIFQEQKLNTGEG